MDALLRPPMARVPEPEIMDDPVQAHAYANADFDDPHQAFVDHFARCFPGFTPQRVLDLGCGNADVTCRFARAWSTATILGIDASAAMLDCVPATAAKFGVRERVQVLQGRLPAVRLDQRFDTVISNSLLHHLHDPQGLWESIRQLAAPGAVVLVMDLVRPDSEAEARERVAHYAADEPEILQRDFFNSLCASFRPEEVREQLARAGLPFTVKVVKDRRLLVSGRMPG
jgi:SAM-dependent methyltransferase